MTIPNLLISAPFQGAFGATAPAELVGGTTITPIGGTPPGAGAAEALSANAKDMSNRNCTYRGQRYTVFRGQSTANNARVYTSDPASPTAWSQVYASGTNTAYLYYSGLYQANTATLQRLFFFAADAGNTLVIHYTDDGSSWSALDTGISIAGARIGDAPVVMFNNKAYYAARQSNVSYLVEVDPIALTATTIVAPWAATSVDTINAALCVFEDRLMILVAETAGAGDYSLWEFTGAGVALNTAITADNRLLTYSDIDTGQMHLFKDPLVSKLVAICNGSQDNTFAGAGLLSFDLVPSGSVFTPTDTTSVVVPAGLRPTVRGASGDHAEDRVLGYASNDVVGAPEHFLFIATGPNPGTGYSVYQYVDSVTEMTFVAAGPSTIYSLPNQLYGGGFRINAGTGNQPIIETGVAVLGGYEVRYRVFGLQVGQTVTGYYSLGQNMPLQQMTIDAQTGGSGLGGGGVTGITGDDGATLFTFRWDIATDGVPNPDAAHLMVDIN